MSSTVNKMVGYIDAAEKIHNRIAEQNLINEIRTLQHWQMKRLLITHDDLNQKKRYKPAIQFLADEIYGPHDFSERDSEFARVVPKMAKVLPEKALISLEAALKLNYLAVKLDFTLVQHLGNRSLDRTTYFDAYRASDNQECREEQIAVLEALSADLAQVVKIPGISALLLVSRKPAKAAGFGNMQAFLERGFKAFKKIGKIEDFIHPIISREKQLLNQLFSSENETQNPLPPDI